MSDRVLMTDQREELINGNYDKDDSTHRVRKHRLENSAETALNELIRIAESPAIDHTEIFDPDDIYQLLRALITADEPHIDTSELEGAGFDNTEDFEAYKNELYVKLDQFLRFRQSLPDE